MMGESGRYHHPSFTATQWQELEDQALVYKYIISGMPIPPHLLLTIKTSLLDDHESSSSSSSTKLLLPHPHPPIGWKCSFHVGFGRKMIDPEPGRCRRTDGKKWRCSKEAYPDSKYCQRHMHRGRNRSRKPVELLTPISATKSPNYPPSHPPYPFFSKCSGTNTSINNSSSSTSSSLGCLALKIDRKDDDAHKVMHHFNFFPPEDSSIPTTSCARDFFLH